MRAEDEATHSTTSAFWPLAVGSYFVPRPHYGVHTEKTHVTHAGCIAAEIQGTASPVSFFKAACVRENGEKLDISVSLGQAQGFSACAKKPDVRKDDDIVITINDNADPKSAHLNFPEHGSITQIVHPAPQ